MKSTRQHTLLPIDGILNSHVTSYRGLDKALVQAVRTGASAERIACDEAILLAVELAVLDPKAPEDQKKDLFILAAALQIARENGSTCVALSSESSVADVIKLAQRHLTGPIALPDAVDVIRQLRELVTEGKSPLIGTPERQCPITVEGDYAYIGRHYHFENSVAKRLQELAARAVPPPKAMKAGELLTEVTQMATISEDGTPKELTSLNKEQTSAVLDAVTHGLTVITGGPGTGKTSIVVGIMRLLVRLGVAPEEIAVATLTGRAAFRLQETITGTMAAVAPKKAGAHKPEVHDTAILDVMKTNGPRTIHRLLSASADGSNFRNNRRSRLRQKWVIIDESSMIDLELAHRLCEALPDDANLILLGDANQLPPVGSGAPFRDLVNASSAIKSQGFAVTRLTMSYRASEKDASGRNILGVAEKVTRGESSALLSSSDPAGEAINIATMDTMPPGSHTHLLAINDPQDLGKFLTRWYSKHYKPIQDYASEPFVQTAGKFEAESQERLRKLLQVFANAKILCLSKDGHAGVHSINRHLRDYRKDQFKLGDRSWYIGEPVIATKNDYQLQIFNGDLGIIVSIATDGQDARPMAVFEHNDGFFAVNLVRIGSNMTLAYAVTVHKAQGGETKHVALMLADADDNLNSRPLIYTAITRASDSVVIVGSPETLTAGVNRDIQRLTRLGAKI